MYGYLLYDTAFTLLFYNAVGSVCFLLHHALGLICCCFGLYFNKMMLFGAAIMVFFEGTTPLLHLLGCLKLMGRDSTTIFMGLGMTQLLQTFTSCLVLLTILVIGAASSIYACERCCCCVAAVNNSMLYQCKHELSERPLCVCLS